jgi:stress response protein YsnF
MDSVLVGIFDSQGAAERAREQLAAAGFAANDVSLTTGEGAADGTVPTSRGPTAETDSPGPIARFFDHLFGGADEPERDRYAEAYREAFRRGAYGVSVRAQNDEQVERAEMILDDAGAVDIDNRANRWGAGAEAAAAEDDMPSSRLQDDTRTLQEIQEELTIGKRTVGRGGVRIFSRIVEIPVAESVTLREEHANVQRRAVDRPATAADFDSFQEGSVEVRETAEEAVVSKTARVVGEVEISKSATEREEIVRESVRRTEVDVEQIEDDAARSAHGGRTLSSADTERSMAANAQNKRPA